MGSHGKLRDGLEVVKATVRIMSRRLPPHVSEDDLLSDAYLGLLKALRQFDRSHDVPFRVYAIDRIRGAILDGLRERDWTPRGAGRVSRIVQDRRHLACISPDCDRITRLERRDSINKALRTLPRRDRLVLQLSYLEQMPLKDIGACFGVTEAAICIVRKNAIRRLMGLEL